MGCSPYYYLKRYYGVTFFSCQECPSFETARCFRTCYILIQFTGFLPSDYEEVSNPDDLPDYSIDPMSN